MSIPSQLTRLRGNITNALDEVEAKGVTVPADANSDDLAELIRAIPTGGVLITDTLDANGGTIREITAMEISGKKTVTANGTNIDVSTYALLDVNVPTSGGTYQEKTNITPSESSQTITPDSGYDALSSVQINAISSTYVGSGITRRSGSDLTASGATVTAPAGYYSSAATKSVAAGSATAPASISGTSASVSTGTNTLTLTKTVSVTPSVTAGYVSSGTAGNSSVSLTANVTTKAAATYYPSTSDQSISASQYLTGAQTIKAVTHNLDASKILSGTTFVIGDTADSDRVASVSGTAVFQTIYSGSSAPSSSTGVNGDIYIRT